MQLRTNQTPTHAPIDRPYNRMVPVPVAPPTSSTGRTAHYRAIMTDAISRSGRRLKLLIVGALVVALAVGGVFTVLAFQETDSVRLQAAQTQVAHEQLAEHADGLAKKLDKNRKRLSKTRKALDKARAELETLRALQIRDLDAKLLSRWRQLEFAATRLVLPFCFVFRLGSLRGHVFKVKDVEMVLVALLLWVGQYVGAEPHFAFRYLIEQLPDVRGKAFVIGDGYNRVAVVELGGGHQAR